MLRAEAIPDFISAGSPFWKPERKITKKPNPVFNKNQRFQLFWLYTTFVCELLPMKFHYVVGAPRRICQL